MKYESFVMLTPRAIEICRKKQIETENICIQAKICIILCGEKIEFA